MLKAAFIFLAPDSDPQRHRTIIKTQKVELTVVGVKNYEIAEEVVKELVACGVKAIELCGGFGNIGVSKISKAAGKNVQVGAVRFDFHPGLGGKSGDEIFINFKGDTS